MKRKSIRVFLFLIAILGVVAIIGCAPPGGVTTPSVISTTPANTATVVNVNTAVTATFSEPMSPASIKATGTFTLMNVSLGTAVPGVVTYDAVTKIASFAPTVVLIGSSTKYTATITTAAKSMNGVALAANKTFSFTTVAAGVGGTLPVLLGSSGNYVILAKAAIGNTGTSVITGNLGLSPAAGSFITGFALTKITGGALSAQVTGVVYAADDAVPTPENLTAAVGAMLAAYSDAALRSTSSPAGTYLNRGTPAGTIGIPEGPLLGGVYTFNTPSDVSIATNLTLQGAANDVWIFQIPGTLTVASSVNIFLTNGALAKNVFWQVGGAVTLGTNCNFNGIILGGSAITLNTGATLNGRALATTAVTLDTDTVVQPLP